MTSNLGWHSRGYLPHCDVTSVTQFITFRLKDSLPIDAIKKLKNEFASDNLKYQSDIEKYLDEGYGKCYLKDHACASIVAGALKFFDGERYKLIAWCIMPNHVHVLIEVNDSYNLPSIVQSWKSFSAKEINKVLGLSGAIWQRDYYDRFIRDTEHLLATMEYIEMNPVKANLTDSSKQWKYSSAYKRC